MPKPITLKRSGDCIDFHSPSGARVAYLLDSDDSIVFDPLADTEEVLGLVNFREVMDAAGLDVVTARAICAQTRQICPESVPGRQ